MRSRSSLWLDRWGALAGDRHERRAKQTGATAFVPQGLLEAARLHRHATLHVIVVGETGVDSGAIMLTAGPLAKASAMSVGVGEIDVAKAAALKRPPNPNAALNRFVQRDRRVPGHRVFDVDAWAEASWSDASWDSASWSDASWDSAGGSTPSWSDVSWTDASWNSASWSDASWNSASWPHASWNSASWTDASCNSASWTDGAPTE